MALDAALNTSMQSIPECLASGYIDMTSGMLLGVQASADHPQETLDTLAAAAADLFQGASVSEFGKTFNEMTGGDQSDEHYFQEIIIFSSNLLHVFMRSKAWPDHVLCYICRSSANPGMVLTKARMSLDSVSEAV